MCQVFKEKIMDRMVIYVLNNVVALLHLVYQLRQKLINIMRYSINFSVMQLYAQGRKKVMMRIFILGIAQLLCWIQRFVSIRVLLANGKYQAMAINFYWVIQIEN